MTTRYHVAPSYSVGSDLLSLDEQINRGIVSEDEARANWKWEHSFDRSVERQFVSLWETLDQATEWAAEYGGVVLAVETDGLSEFIWDEDTANHPAVMGFVPAANVEIVK